MTSEDIGRGVARWANAVGDHLFGPRDPVVNPTRAFTADADITTPDQDFLVYKVVVHDIPMSWDNPMVLATPAIVWTNEGERSGLVSLNAYGKQAAQWLELMSFLRQRPDIQTILDDNGLTAVEAGGVQDLSALQDSHTRQRYMRDFNVYYRRVTAISEQLPAVDATNVDVSTELSGSPAGTLIIPKNYQL